MAFIHPILGTLAILLGVFIMSRGLVAQRKTKAATKARRSHKRWAWYALYAMVIAWVTGFASTVWLRDDIELGDTWHLAVGIAVVVLMALGGLLTRYFTKRQELRSIHPWIGIAAVAGAILQGVLGIILLP